MKRIMIALTVVIATMATSILAIEVAQAAPEHPINGLYFSSDVVDDSELTLLVEGEEGGEQQLVLKDSAGTVCLRAGLGFVAASFQGMVEYTSPDTFDVTGDVVCLSGGRWVTVIEDLTISFKYEVEAAMLIDHTGQGYWRR